jgi:uncharacterized protein (DUF1810 family)
MTGQKFDDFVAAQDSCYERVQQELIAGRKKSHWIWFIFPQIAGLGFSSMAKRFALDSLDEARRYLQHPVLGVRLLECTRLLLAIPDRNIDQILGYPDNLKFRSCMTLFALAAPEETLFSTALEKHFQGIKDPLTTEIIGENK